MEKKKQEEDYCVNVTVDGRVIRVDCISYRYSELENIKLLFVMRQDYDNAQKIRDWQKRLMDIKNAFGDIANGRD